MLSDIVIFHSVRYNLFKEQKKGLIKMEQKLKMSTSRTVVAAMFVVILAAIGAVTVYYGLTHPETFVIAYDWVSFALVIVLVIAVAVYLAISIYNNTARPLTFNNISFTYKGKTYTYQQIEKIKLIGSRFGSVAYEIRIDGKSLYAFDDEYEGAKEFMYYLNFYNVPGTPRT